MREEFRAMDEVFVRALTDDKKVELIMMYQKKEVERLEKLRLMGKKYRMSKVEKDKEMKRELEMLRAKVNNQ